MQSQVKKKPTKKNSAKIKRRARVKNHAELIPIEEYAKSISAEDFKNDPFFKKKADDAQAFLKKHPFPIDLLPKK
jgi:hypothetical protein